MNKKHLMCAMAALTLSAAYMWGRAAPDASHAVGAFNVTSSESRWRALPEASESTSRKASVADQEMSSQELARLHAAYEQLSPEDRVLVQQTRAYEGFMGRMNALLGAAKPGGLNLAEAQQVMLEIDHFQRDDYYSLNHALQMKMAIARMVYQGGELDSRLAEMQAQFEREHADLVARSDPTRDPIYIAFKADEGAMIDQARRMSSFPDGLTRDQHIIRESEKIRAAHYPD